MLYEGCRKILAVRDLKSSIYSAYQKEDKEIKNDQRINICIRGKYQLENGSLIEQRTVQHESEDRQIKI